MTVPKGWVELGRRDAALRALCFRTRVVGHPVITLSRCGVSGYSCVHFLPFLLVCTLSTLVALTTSHDHAPRLTDRINPEGGVRCSGAAISGMCAKQELPRRQTTTATNSDSHDHLDGKNEDTRETITVVQRTHKLLLSRVPRLPHTTAAKM